MLLEKRVANEIHGIEVSETKAVTGETLTTRMGAWVDGDVGRVSVPPDKIFELLHFGFWLLSDITRDAKGLAMFLGRLIRAFEFRRPLMGILNDVWRYTQWEGRLVLSNASVMEIVVALAMLPMAFSDLRSQIDLSLIHI